MSKKHKIPVGVQMEFADVDYWHKLSRKKTILMEDGTRLSEYEYMKRFMHEYYGNRFDRQDDAKNILQTEDQKKEARRNNNNLNRDALMKSKKMGALNVLYQVEKTQYDEIEESWETTFKKGTYNQALKELLRVCCDDFNISYTKLNVRKLFKVYFRLTKFIKLVRVDKRTRKGNNEKT